MSFVKTLRAIGSVLDAEDRKVIGQLLVIVGAFLVMAVTLGASVGLAFRMFDLASGG